MAQVKKITLEFKDGTTKTMSHDNSKWLLVAFKDDKSYRQLSLSGDDMNDAYLLLMLQLAVHKVVGSRNGYTQTDTWPTLPHEGTLE